MTHSFRVRHHGLTHAVPKELKVTKTADERASDHHPSRRSRHFCVKRLNTNTMQQFSPSPTSLLTPRWRPPPRRFGNHSLSTHDEDAFDLRSLPRLPPSRDDFPLLCCFFSAEPRTRITNRSQPSVRPQINEDSLTSVPRALSLSLLPIRGHHVFARVASGPQPQTQ